MYYIGISAYYHESSVFLTDNNGTNCFLKEESFSRIKGDKNFPKRSLKFLIKKFELKKENIKFICFYEKPFKTWWEIFYFSIKNPLQNKDFLIHHLKNFNKGSIFFYTDINKLINIPKNDNQNLMSKNSKSAVFTALFFCLTKKSAMNFTMNVQ